MKRVHCIILIAAAVFINLNAQPSCFRHRDTLAGLYPDIVRDSAWKIVHQFLFLNKINTILSNMGLTLVNLPDGPWHQ